MRKTTAVFGLVLDKIPAPDLIGSTGSLPLARARSQALHASLLLAHLEVLLSS